MPDNTLPVTAQGDIIRANVATGKDTLISLPDSKVKVAVIATNEELVIAQDTMHIVVNEEENN